MLHTDIYVEIHTYYINIYCLLILALVLKEKGILGRPEGIDSFAGHEGRNEQKRM